MAAITGLESLGFGSEYREGDGAYVDASVHGAYRGASATKLRLTRRGRAVFGTLGVLIAGAVLAGAAVLFAPNAVASDDFHETEFSYVLVQPGDSLWGIAQALDPGADTRDIVAELKRLNQLSTSDLEAGAAIAVPLRFAGADGMFSAEEVGL